MTLIQSTRSRPRSHVLHSPSRSPEIQNQVPNRTVTESHLLGVCSATDAEPNGILLGLPLAATLCGRLDGDSILGSVSREFCRALSRSDGALVQGRFPFLCKTGSILAKFSFRLFAD